MRLHTHTVSRRAVVVGILLAGTLVMPTVAYAGDTSGHSHLAKAATTLQPRMSGTT